MNPSRCLAPIVGALALSIVIGLSPVAHADTGDTLAATTVAGAEAVCVRGAPTFDNVVVAAASSLRTAVPSAQVADYDRAVTDFRHGLATLRVRRDVLPVNPATVNARTDFLDDPLVTYLVNGLDAIRTGRIDTTMSVTQLTLDDALEVFVLATGIVKIPAQFAASLVPTVGFLLKPIVGALATGAKALARKLQDHLAATCTSPGAYPALSLGEPEVEHVEVPAQLRDLANSVVRADGTCTPIAELTLRTVAERTRDFLTHSDLPVDRAAVQATSEALRTFLNDNRIAHIALLRRAEQLGPIVDAMDFGPLTFLANLGFDIYEGKALDTVPLAEMRVEHVFDLVTLSLEVTSLLLSAGNTVVGLATGGAGGVPLTIAQNIAFAPLTYGAPILRGVMQSMCGA